MLKNKSLLLLLTLLTYTTTYNKRTGQQAQQQQIPQQAPVFVPTVSIPMPKQQPSFAKATADKQPTTQQLPRPDSNFGSASVLPFIQKNKKYFFILSREAFGKAKDTYDDFGGSRDPGENHPFITAAREFFEEAILQPSTGLSLENTGTLIDIAQSNNTQYIVVYSRNVTYITDFTKYADKLFNNFYTARSKMKNFHFIEKDRLALVDWDLLKTTINNTMFNSGVAIDAQVLDPQTLQWKPETIILRDFFVKKLRPFFMTKPYEKV